LASSSSGFALEAFLASEEARGVAGASEEERREIASRLHEALGAVGRPLAKLGAGDVHGWLFHAVPEQFDPVDPLVPHVGPVLRALVEWSARTSGEKLERLRRELDGALPELEHALAHGHAHHHPDDDDEQPQEPYVRAAPKVGRNDPCPCGSGKKFKKCHGA
jgi:hypothetical protein